MKKRATKAKKKPSRKRQQIIVLVDGAGNYYEIPRGTFERTRVEPARKERVAAALQDVPLEHSWKHHDRRVQGRPATPLRRVLPKASDAEAVRCLKRVKWTKRLRAWGCSLPCRSPSKSLIRIHCITGSGWNHRSTGISSCVDGS